METTASTLPGRECVALLVPPQALGGLRLALFQGVHEPKKLQMLTTPVGTDFYALARLP